jgi:hypothetical protein
MSDCVTALRQAALTQLGRIAALELAQHGIRVNTVREKGGGEGGGREGRGVGGWRDGHGIRVNTVRENG